MTVGLWLLGGAQPAMGSGPSARGLKWGLAHMVARAHRAAEQLDPGWRLVLQARDAVSLVRWRSHV